MEKRYNIRAYGILINHKKEVLLSDEYRHKRRFTKFPGGGLEWGEGLKDCVVREFYEGTQKAVEVVEHFYTTDFFQLSAFNENDQLISVYYIVKMKDEDQLKTSGKLFDFKKEEGAQSLRWVPQNEISEDQMTFPVDKVVAEMLRT